MNIKLAIVVCLDVIYDILGIELESVYWINNSDWSEMWSNNSKAHHGGAYRNM